LAVRLTKALGLPFTCRRRSLGDKAAEQPDLETALKVSEEISGERILERLTDKILRIAIEHAGALRGLLIVPRGEELRIEAEARAAGEDVTVHPGESVDRAAALPESVLRSVVLTQQAVLVDDAAAPNAFSEDPYIARHATRSILCLPLLNRGKLIGLLYLENNLATGVFAPARITVLKLLASQAATSFENARLYRELTESEAKFRRAEQAWRQGEAYLAESQRLTRTGSWAFDQSAGKAIYWSEEMFRIYGRDPRRESLPTYDELLRFVHPDDRESFNRASENGGDKTGMTVDFRIVMADGSAKHVQSTRLPVLDKTTAVTVGTLVDVTERRHAEQHLLVQYRVTRILADAVTVEEATPMILQTMCECLGWDLGVVWRIDPKAGVLRCAQLWRTSSFAAAQFEVVARSSTFRSGGGLPGRVWATGAPAYIPDVGQDEVFCRADIAARQVPRAAIAFPILLGREVIGVVGFISRDVSQPDQELLVVLANIGCQIGQFTKRTAAVDELKLRVSMLQNIPVAAWSVTPDGTPDIVNQLWYEYTGQTPDFVNSHPEAWMATLHPEDRERASQSYWDGIRSGRGFTMEARFLRAGDGAYRWHLNRAVPVRDAEGNLLRLVGTSTDVHDWRQAQEALRNTQTEFAHMTRVMTMGELTASIAHEVNQPLGAMVTSAAAGARWLATKPPQMDKARRALERIANDGKRAAEVIRRIRALMKRQAPRKEWLDINETILEVIALAQYQLRRNAILLETRLGHHLPLVRGDRVQLQQVLLNLTINAIEAMSAIRERPRELTLVSASDGPDTVSVEVRDSGTGLDPEHAPHVFEPFFTTKEEGLGIGLSISLSILEAHGGRLSAAANAPHGTVFLFSLPVNETVP
jgi:PAS domain S-box-containing protein